MAGYFTSCSLIDQVCNVTAITSVIIGTGFESKQSGQKHSFVALVEFVMRSTVRAASSELE